MAWKRGMVHNWRHCKMKGMGTKVKKGLGD